MGLSTDSDKLGDTASERCKQESLEKTLKSCKETSRAEGLPLSWADAQSGAIVEAQIGTVGDGLENVSDVCHCYLKARQLRFGNHYCVHSVTVEKLRYSAEMDNPLFPKAPLIHCLPLVRKKISHHPVRLPPPGSVVFHRRDGSLYTAFAVCVSFSGFETKLWLAARWGPAERRFPHALAGRDTCWSGTPSPAPAAACWCTPFWVGE